MRLIDADEFKDYIIDSLESYKLLTDEYRDFAGEIIRGFLKDLDAQPTAYDVDKVVEQLEEASCYIEDGYGHAGHLVFTDEAIEIVKKGGEQE